MEEIRTSSACLDGCVWGMQMGGMVGFGSSVIIPGAAPAVIPATAGGVAVGGAIEAHRSTKEARKELEALNRQKEALENKLKALKGVSELPANPVPPSLRRIFSVKNEGQNERKLSALHNESLAFAFSENLALLSTLAVILMI